MKKTALRPGLTMIELVVGIVIVSIAFYALIAVFATIAPRTATIENIDKKSFLAQEKMEELMARPWDSLPTLESGSFSGSFSIYQYQISVTQVATADLSTPAPSNLARVSVRVWGGSVDRLATVEIVTLAVTYEVK